MVGYLSLGALLDLKHLGQIIQQPGSMLIFPVCVDQI